MPGPDSLVILFTYSFIAVITFMVLVCFYQDSVPGRMLFLREMLTNVHSDFSHSCFG